MVVGCIPEIDDRVLFCRRSIMPRYGKWTIPAGYLEKGETVEAGAMRETFEEAGARMESLEPYGLYNLTFISQVYLIFRGRVADGNFCAGHESLEVRLFREEDVPWVDLAFPVIRVTLKSYFRDRPNKLFPFHINEIKSDSSNGWDS
jgi:ADP-ribose pyrophosphatase YjhB (NUDIX family)